MTEANKEKDVVDVEFTDVEVGPAGEDLWAAPPMPPKRRLPWGALVGGAIVLGLVGIYFYSHHASKNLAERIASWPIGWADLIDCHSAISLDGKRELDFSDDQRVIRYERPITQNSHSVEGTWQFDQTTKQYAVAIDGVTTSYSIFEPEGGGCMLIRGAPSAANLNASWFAITDEPDK